MKTTLFTLALLSMTASIWAQKTIELEALPNNIDDFVQWRDAQATTPEGGAAVYIAAMWLYTQNKTEGMKAIIVASHKQLLVESEKEGSYKGFFPTPGYDQDIRNYFGPKPYIANSYFNNTKPEDNYKLPSKLSMTFTRNAYSEADNGDIKVFVKCSGAASPRPITLRKNDKGIWKVINYSSLFVGVIPPGKEVDDL